MFTTIQVYETCDFTRVKSGFKLRVSPRTTKDTKIALKVWLFGGFILVGFFVWQLPCKYVIQNLCEASLQYWIDIIYWKVGLKKMLRIHFRSYALCLSSITFVCIYISLLYILILFVCIWSYFFIHWSRLFVHSSYSIDFTI